jgi:hypothetical protein
MPNLHEEYYLHQRADEHCLRYQLRFLYDSVVQSSVSAFSKVFRFRLLRGCLHDHKRLSVDCLRKATRFVGSCPEVARSQLLTPD